MILMDESDQLNYLTKWCDCSQGNDMAKLFLNTWIFEDAVSKDAHKLILLRKPNA